MKRWASLRHRNYPQLVIHQAMNTAPYPRSRISVTTSVILHIDHASETDVLPERPDAAKPWRSFMDQFYGHDRFAHRGLPQQLDARTVPSSSGVIVRMRLPACEPESYSAAADATGPDNGGAVITSQDRWPSCAITPARAVAVPQAVPGHRRK
jgi:hypothetical protein